MSPKVTFLGDTVCSQCNYTLYSKRSHHSNTEVQRLNWCPQCKARLTLTAYLVDSVKLAFKSMPALLPAWVISAFLVHEVYTHFTSGLSLLGMAMASLMVFTYAGKKLMLYVLQRIQEAAPARKKRYYTLFWAYVIGVYALFGLSIAVESQWPVWGSITCVVLFALVGGMSNAKWLGLIDEDGKEITIKSKES